jgi:flagellar biosynthetic protein FliP
LFSALALILLSPKIGVGQTIPIPSVNLSMEETSEPVKIATSLKVLFLLTILTLAPSLLILTTSFARIIVVLSFLRQALGTQQMPPNHVLIGLSLFLTFFIMMPVWTKVNTESLQPFLSEEISQEVALERGLKPIREFMLHQTREKDLGLFVSIANLQTPKSVEDIPTHVIVPAFVISELKTGFQIGFLIYIPFLVLDMVVASVLMSMGMLMLPPILISLPFKLMLFVLVDGWHLLVGSLIKSFY